MPDYAEACDRYGMGTILLDADIRTAYHDTELLRSTYLSAPQAVQLSKKLCQMDESLPPLLTPDEIAGLFTRAPEGWPV
jgi:energy-coupling factor transport system ATP-binding protein